MIKYAQLNDTRWDGRAVRSRTANPLTAVQLRFPPPFFILMRRKTLSNIAALVLSSVAWFWTAYECDIIGIQVFDVFLKRFSGQLWIMAAVLTYLTYIWMRKHLITRSIMAIFMLMPAEAFKLIRPHLPAEGFAPVQVLVFGFYILAVIGMYGMFYPWRVEKFLAKIGLLKQSVEEECPGTEEKGASS